VRCGRTSDATSVADAQEQLEKFDCVVTKEAAIYRRVEVKVGSRSVVVEQSELDNLIDVLIEMRELAARGRAFMNLGSA
jgi:hypothetical protein